MSGFPSPVRFTSDSSGEVGFASTFKDHIIRVALSSSIIGRSSAFKELVPIYTFFSLFGPLLKNTFLVLSTDNAGNVFSLNKASCRSKDSLYLLRALFRLAADHNIHFVADWFPRDCLEFVDFWSRQPLSIQA